MIISREEISNVEQSYNRIRPIITDVLFIRDKEDIKKFAENFIFLDTDGVFIKINDRLHNVDFVPIEVLVEELKKEAENFYLKKI